MNNQVTNNRAPLIEKIPYPSHPFLKYAFKSPLLLWRMGLGPVLGRLFMILTTEGRKSGLPRHTPLEYHVVNGRPHVVAAWPQSDWHRNLQANPRVTIQTAAGTQSMVARRLASDEELSDLFDYAESHPTLRRIWEALSIDFSRESFLADKERYHILTFEPTTEPTPPPLKVDLWWVWPAAVVGVFLVIWFFKKMMDSTPMIVVSKGEIATEKQERPPIHRTKIHKTIEPLDELGMPHDNASDDAPDGITADIWKREKRLRELDRLRTLQHAADFKGGKG